MKTARQVVAEELVQWTTREDIGRLSALQRLEHATSIWEYGKWCAKGGRSGLGCKPQIKFRGSRPEQSAWDGIADLSDDEGMRIHAATIGLSDQSVEIIRRSYECWENSADAAKGMRMRHEMYCALRRKALEFIAEGLTRELETPTNTQNYQK